MQSRSTAVLLHLVDWTVPSAEVCIAPGIWLARTEGSQVGELYQRLSREAEFRYEPEGGDPFEYTVHIRIETPPVDVDVDVGSPFARVDLLCNLLTVLFGRPIFLVRVLSSADRFETANATQMLYHYTEHGMSMFGGRPALTESVARELSQAWYVAQSRWSKNAGRSRVANALAFYQYAWRAEFPEHMCLNLCTALETLFAPHAMGETVHQVAFNIAHFLGNAPKSREDYYRGVKRFYGIRSGVIHGGMPDPEKVENGASEAFAMCVDVLRAIILSDSLTAAFDDEVQRKELLLKYQFGPWS